MPNASSFVAAARRPAAPGILELIDGGDPAMEVPEQGSEGLASLRKPERITLTPLHCNIPVLHHRKLTALMAAGYEKTAIVQEALRRIFEDEALEPLLREVR